MGLVHFVTCVGSGLLGCTRGSIGIAIEGLQERDEGDGLRGYGLGVGMSIAGADELPEEDDGTRRVHTDIITWFWCDADVI